jgi:gas vesicle protein
MAEYGLAIMRKYDRHPQQLVLYVGNEPMHLRSGFRTEGMSCQYKLVDIRSLDGAALLATDTIADNMLALLTRLDDPVTGIRTVLGRIMRLRRDRQRSVLEQFLLTCQMRGLEGVAIRELGAMPQTLQIDIEKWPFLQEAVAKKFAKLAKKVDKEAREKVRRETERLREETERLREEAGRLRGEAERLRAQVREEGREKGLEEGREEGLKDALRLLLNKRFGRLPATVTKRLAAMSDAEVKELTLAILDAKSLKELFGKSR